MSAAGSGGAGALVLIEPLAATRGGHWTKSLALLAESAERTGRSCMVVGINGLHPEIEAALSGSGAETVTAPPRRFGTAAAALAAARALDRAYGWLQPRIPHRPLPYQLQHLARCLAEVASLRAAAASLPPGQPFTAVVLTANETLHGLTVALSGAPHVRWVHEVTGYECRTIRVVERLLEPVLARAAALCPTPTVAAALGARYPTLACTVTTFALNDPRAYIAEPERAAARARLGVAPDRAVGSIVGGWWRAKDPLTVVQALSGLRDPFTLVVAGYRIDREVVAGMAAAHGGELRVLDGQLSSEELRSVYAASDFTIVSRHPNGKESGVALDAVALGVPVVVSDHDPGLTRGLTNRAWARVFRCGDARSLALALDDATARPLERPPQGAAGELGMLEADEMVAVFDHVMPLA